MSINTHPFYIFLQDIKKKAHALYILGDLFECWWGDDHHNHNYQQWEQCFVKCPFPIYFLPGNRDFLCSKKFFERSGLKPITSGAIVFWGNDKIGLLHGDEPGLEDYPYQYLRFILRHPIFMKFFDFLPVNLRKILWTTGRKYRKQQSAPIGQEKNVPINHALWLKNYFPQTKPNILIHGHLHKKIKRQEQDYLRYQLSSWDDGSIHYLKIDSESSIDFL